MDKFQKKESFIFLLKKKKKKKEYYFLDIWKIRIKIYSQNRCIVRKK